MSKQQLKEILDTLKRAKFEKINAEFEGVRINSQIWVLRFEDRLRPTVFFIRRYSTDFYKIGVKKKAFPIPLRCLKFQKSLK